MYLFTADKMYNVQVYELTIVALLLKHYDIIYLKLEVGVC